MIKEAQACLCSQETDEEKLARIAQIIEEHNYAKDSLIQVLHYAQGIFGYLPLDVQKFIAKKMSLPLSEIYGVATFYSFFSLHPRGEYTIRVCLGTACYVRGGKKIIDKLKDVLKIDVGETTPDMKFSLDVMRCIGACGLAPAITINDKVFKQVNPDRIEKILEKYY